MSNQTFRLVNENVKRNALHAVQTAPMDVVYEVTVKPYKKNRSLSQNSLYWKWVTEIQKHIESAKGEHYKTDDIHDFLREKFLPQRVVAINDETFKSRKSTAKLKVKEFTEYLEQIDFYASDSLQLPLPYPEDLYYEAMGK